MPQEIAFFDQAGLGTISVVLLGAIQVAGGFLAVIPRFRRVGMGLVALGFFASAAVILTTGALVFAAVSLVPAVFAVLFVIRKIGPQPA